MSEAFVLVSWKMYKKNRQQMLPGVKPLFCIQHRQDIFLYLIRRNIQNQCKFRTEKLLCIPEKIFHVVILLKFCLSENRLYMVVF